VTSIFNTVLPVFGMILVGYAFAWAKIMDASAVRGLSLFVFNAALPALLFQSSATVDMADVAPWSLWFAFFGGAAITFGLTWAVARNIEGLNQSGSAVMCTASVYGNIGLLGVPLALSHFGDSVGVPLGLILSVHAPLMWTAATVHREMARNAGGPNWSALGWELFRSLGTNAIVLALLFGALWRITGLGLHPIPDKMLSMMADASVPTSLIALGASLAAYSLHGSWHGMFLLVAMKMLVMPLAVFLLAHFVFPLPPLYAKIAVLFAAMPTGANAFLFAQRYDEAVPAVSAAVALGTGLAAISASVLLYLADAGVI
jgi:malonate transporter and related proteins